MGYLRLEKAPLLSYNLPDCDACEREVEDDGYEFKCPSCGTTWSLDASPSEPGRLSEKATGPACPNEWAWRVEHFDGAERDQAVQSFLDRQP